MTEFKIKVNPHESDLVQKLLFLAGYRWYGGSTDVHRLGEQYLYFNYNSLSWGSDYNYFTRHLNPEITFEQFLNEIEIELNNKNV